MQCTKSMWPALLILLALWSPIGAQPFSELVVFGDSHSDTGNWLDERPEWWLDPSYLDGRFSNGPVWVEEVATQLNLLLPTPSETGGLNYAWGGARTGYGYDSTGGLMPRVGTQVVQYLGGHSPEGDELVTLFVGHNDFGWGAQSNPAAPVILIGRHIQDLAAAGVEYFLVPNLHPLGHLPAYRGTSRESTLNALTTEFNDLLLAELERLESEIRVTVFQFDFSELIEEALADPSIFGLVNVTDTAWSDGVVVPNPDEYLYWDDHHFTAAFYQVMGQRAAAMVVPEPASLALSTFYLVVMLVLCRNACSSQRRTSDITVTRA